MYEQIARNKRLAAVYIGLFFVIWVGIGALLGFLAAPAGRDVVTGAAIFAVLACGAIVLALRSGAKLVLSVSKAHPADTQEFAQLHNIVEALAIGEGIPKPDVYVIDDPSPNAFATGASPEHAAITVTTGLLAMMNREELEGVVGHEMSHIKNYDVRLLLIVSTLIGIAGLLASLVWRSAFFMRPRRGRNGDQTMLLVIAAGALLALVAMIFGPLIRMALSRRREELADVSGVELTRNPAGLISALRKLEQSDRPFATFNHATAAMCIDNPLEHQEGWWRGLFNSHPPISERIAILERIASGAIV
jgi:heat shock protein HtpX